VRPNAGGDEAVALGVAGCFVRKPSVYSKSTYRDPAAAGGFTRPKDRLVGPNTMRPAVSAPTVALVGPANMSSCESFLLMMRAAGVPLIGERSYGSSGNPKPHEIADGLQVVLPSWKDLFPDGTLLEGRGVEPDIRVPTTAGDFAAGDPVLERALAHLRKQAETR
jgi:C-terminal processing protease CtpA/Prc